VALLLPPYVSKSYARNNAADINFGDGKIWTYARSA
jgi:hypothetical protein